MKKDECPPPPAEHDAALTLLVQVCCHTLKRDLFGVLCLSGGVVTCVFSSFFFGRLSFCAVLFHFDERIA